MLSGSLNSCASFAATEPKIIGVTMSLFLPEGYEVRDTPEYYDDSENTDNWQREVYILARKLAEKLGIEHVYDYGCGSGYKLVSNFSGSGLAFCGVDLPPTVSFLRETYPYYPWLSVNEFKFTSLHSKSMLICSDVIEHMQDPNSFLESLASSCVGVVVFSTPARELLVLSGQTPELGPPTNKSHCCEWTCLEFNKYIKQYFDITEHFVSHVIQATQVVIAYRKDETKSNRVKILSQID